MRRGWLAVLLVLAASRAHASSCYREPTPVEAFVFEWQHADALFVGVAEAVERDAGAPLAVRFRPLLFLRGAAPPGPVRIESYGGTAWGGYPFMLGDTYVVAASAGGRGRLVSWEDSAATAPLSGYAVFLLGPLTFLLTVAVLHLRNRLRDVGVVD